ncbi:hypothetical protein FSP39_018718 [Pinctada imbricata]|uniref:cystathionine gamma-lyase n=1 Tax=Pinctada imbricata TaxID=66713 RepID=A0AA88XSY9_PINIB|nr:hypothetical protein FSP39_018718 [Pinctada imbricata]
MDDLKPFPGFGTSATHAGQDPEKWNSRAVVPPISMSTTFKQKGPGDHYGFEYSRSGNPTRNCLEECIAALEGAKHGLVFASGLATTTAVTHLLKSGDHIISMNDVYGGTNRYFQKCAVRMGIETAFIDCTVPSNVEKAIKDNTKMIWLETPTNPTMQLVDIKAVVDVVKKKNPKIFIVVDNTFMSSYFQRPLDFGADMVMHSLTKYMNGHSDVVMGAIATNNDDYEKELRFLQNAFGAVPSPFDSFLVNRGLKTLHVRMKEHMKNGLAVAKFLEKHPYVTKVIHPGLPSHPQHELAKRQMRGYSGMVTFFLDGGLKESQVFLQNLKIFTLAESLGGFESLAELPSVMTHASVPEKEREQLGISDSLIRLSVGIEDEADLIEDLDQALNIAEPPSEIGFPPTLIAFVTLQQLVFVLGCTGNLAVVVVFVKHLKLQSVSNRVVISLAVSDFLTGIAAGIQIFYFLIPSMNMNKNLCFLRYRIVSTTTITSQLHVWITTFDRYIAICHPHRYKNIMTDKLANILILSSWLYSLTVGALPFFGLNNWQERIPCIYHFLFHSSVFLMDSVSVFSFMTATFVLYILVAKVAWRFMKTVHPVLETNEQKNKRITLQNNIRSARVWLLVTIAFCLCWAPFTVFPLGIGIGHSFSNSALDAMNWLAFIGMSNAFMNAFIYAWKRRDFRKACQKTLCCASNMENQVFAAPQGLNQPVGTQQSTNK